MSYRFSRHVQKKAERRGSKWSCCEGRRRWRSASPAWSARSSPARASDQSLGGRRLGDAPHLHPGPLLLLAAGAVGAVSGAAIQRHHQADGGEDEKQQQDDGRQADGQQEVRGQAFGGQLERLEDTQIRSFNIGAGFRVVYLRMWCDIDVRVAPFPAPLTVSRYTRRSARAARVLTDALPGSAGGSRPPRSSSCRGARPPSVCRLALTLATASASPSVAAIAKPTRHGASTAATREPRGARSVCGGIDHTGRRQKMAPDDPRRPTRYNHHRKHAGNIGRCRRRSAQEEELLRVRPQEGALMTRETCLDSFEPRGPFDHHTPSARKELCKRRGSLCMQTHTGLTPKTWWIRAKSKTPPQQVDD